MSPATARHAREPTRELPTPVLVVGSRERTRRLVVEQLRAFRDFGGLTVLDTRTCHDPRRLLFESPGFGLLRPEGTLLIEDVERLDLELQLDLARHMRSGAPRPRLILTVARDAWERAKAAGSRAPSWLHTATRFAPDPLEPRLLALPLPAGPVYRAIPAAPPTRAVDHPVGRARSQFTIEGCSAALTGLTVFSAIMALALLALDRGLWPY